MSHGHTFLCYTVFSCVTLQIFAVSLTASEKAVLSAFFVASETEMESVAIFVTWSDRNLSVKPAGWPAKITTFRSDTAMPNCIHYSTMSIMSTFKYITTFQFNQVKTMRVNFNLLCLSRSVCVPLCILCGRSVTHRSPNIVPTRPATQCRNCEIIAGGGGWASA